MIAWPVELVREIARRRSVIFLGAGISMQCVNQAGLSPKGWGALLDAALVTLAIAEARKREIRRLIKSSDYLTACEVIRETMGDQPFHTFLTQELLTPNFQPAPIHDTLIQLGSRIYATPNFDKIFENRAGANAAFRVKCYYDTDVVAALKGADPTILKLHGTIDAPDKVIFTRADYTKARNDFWGFYAILEALSITHTFMFVGCGLSDPDIRLLLEDHAFIHKWAAPHYFVVSKQSIAAAIVPAVERNLNIKIIEYSGGHTQLKPELDELRSRVATERAGMQVDGSW